jgi:RNA polymerase sigma factor (sigma-70 family)
VDALSPIAVRSSAHELPNRLALLGDEQLARLVESGSEPAFATIYARHHQRLYRYCRSVLRDSDDAYDALQSTLAGALAALQRGQRDAPLRPWLFRIAHNEAVSLIRRRGPVGEPSDAAEPCAASAEHQAGERARLALLVADLRELTERERSVLLMHELSGLTHREIATALGISIHRVKHAISEARRSLVEFEDGRVMACEAVRKSITYEEERGLRHGRMRAHLRDCTTCAAFVAAIPARRADLQALAPPLSPVLAAGLLARLHATGSASSAGGVGGAATGVAGKTVGATLLAKTFVGVAIVATAAATATGALATVTRGAVPPRVAQAAHTARHAGATRAREPAIVAALIGADSARAPYGGAPAGELGGRSADAIGGVPSPSTSTGASGSDGARAVSDGAQARELRPVGDLGSPPPTGAGSQKGGRGAGGGRHADGPRGISAIGAQHRAGRSERSRAAANGGGAAGTPEAGVQHAGGPREGSGVTGNGAGAAGGPGAMGNPRGSGGPPGPNAGSPAPPSTGPSPVAGLPPVTGPPTPAIGVPPVPVKGQPSPSGAAGASGQPTLTQSVVGSD